MKIRVQYLYTRANGPSNHALYLHLTFAIRICTTQAVFDSLLAKAVFQCTRLVKKERQTELLLDSVKLHLSSSLLNKICSLFVQGSKFLDWILASGFPNLFYYYSFYWSENTSIIHIIRRRNIRLFPPFFSGFDIIYFCFQVLARAFKF